MSLKRELEDPASAIRGFLADNANRIKLDRSRWKSAVAGASPVLPQPSPDGSPVPFAVLGHAIGARIAWTYGPIGSGAIEHGAQVVLRAGASKALIHALLGEMAGPVPADRQRAGRVAWWAGLFEQALRSGRVDADWYEPLRRLTDVDEVLAAAPDWWIADVIAVTEHSSASMPVPGSTPSACGPTFPGSMLVGGADADLIVGGLLVDIKAIISPSLKTRDYNQIVAYALLDTDDSFALEAIALASVRYGVLVRWELGEVFGGRSQLAALRRAMSEELTRTA